MMTVKRNKRRAQRYRSAQGLHGIERSSGAEVLVRDFSSEALAIESTAHLAPGRPIDLGFLIAGRTLTVRGTVVRIDRLPSLRGMAWCMTVIKLAWATPAERLEMAGFLSAIRKSVRPV